MLEFPSPEKMSEIRRAKRKAERVESWNAFKESILGLVAIGGLMLMLVIAWCIFGGMGFIFVGLVIRAFHWAF